MTQAQVRAVRRRLRQRRKRVKPPPTRDHFGATPEKKGRRK